MVDLLKVISLFIFVDGVVSYSVRQGDKRGTELEFFDFTYDGMRQDNFLLDGLGQLTDGQVGDYNFRLDNQELGIKGSVTKPLVTIVMIIFCIFRISITLILRVLKLVWIIYKS